MKRCSSRLASGQDIRVLGSSIISDTGTTLAAGRNLTLEAAQNTQSSSSLYEKKESGLLDSGGAGITIGSREQSTDQKNRSTSAAASTVGSIGGNVTLIAGEQYRQVGSDVMAPNGDITIVAKKVDIVEARETSRTDIEQRFKQSGITVAISNPVLSAMQNAEGMAQAIDNTSDGRMQALGIAAAGLNAYNTYNSLLDKDGSVDPQKAASISINVSIGSSQSQSNSSSESNTARGSTVAAGNNVSITATGAGQDSNLTVQGSEIKAGNNAILAADNQVNLLAAQNTASQSSTNSSSSGSIGVSLGSNTGVTLSASKGRGNSDGQDTSYTNTNITAGNTAIVQSGGDTNLKGAVVTANTVKANVGGNLNIESLQDTSTYNSQQSSAGGSITIGPGFIPTGGGISASNSHINSNFQSVNETSGIKAGDGGFQVNVQGNTDLKGSVIASTQAAVDNNKNSFQTGGTLSTSDIQNTANYNGSGYTVSASTGSGQDPKGNTIYMPGGGAGVASAQGSASSVTQSGISGIAGNTAVRTGDAETGIQKIFDAQKVQREMDAQMAITAAFGQQASRAVGDYAGQKLKDAITNKDQAEIDKWKEGGSARVALHALVGGLAGDLAGAAGAAASQSFIPMIGEEIAKLDIPVELKQALIAAAGTAIVATVGGAAGAASGFNATVNNYLNHNRPSMLRLSEREKYEAAVVACGAGDTAACNTRDELAAQSVQRDRELAQACAGQTPDYCNDQKTKAISMGNKVFTTVSGYTYAVSPTFTLLNPSTIGSPLDPRTGTFQDAVARSTAEALLLETGNQVAGAAVSLLVREAIGLGKVSMNATVDMLENMALRNVQVGAINNFRTAEAVNATMKSVAGWEPAWQAGTIVTDVTMKPGSRVSMVVTEADYNAIIIRGDTSKLGGWATYDNVTSQAYARNQLAITENMKGNVGYVIELEVTRPVYAQVGVVGGQGNAIGGGSQLHFVVPPGERASTFNVVGGRALP